MRGLRGQGEVLRGFVREYVPEHPRPYTWRDVRPTVGIIRFDDSCFDIRQRSLGEYPGPLFGHIPAEQANTEWFHIWNLLTHGYVRTDCLTHNWETKLPIARSLFAPLNNAVVYDHLVTSDLIDELDWIFLTGHRIPPATLDAVQQRVRKGAACIAPARFLPQEARSQRMDDVTFIDDGAGRWIVPRDFYWLHYEPWKNGPCYKPLRDGLDGLLGSQNCLSYRFGERRLNVRMVNGDPDILEYAMI
jgi:hypothetical protein